MDPEAVCLTCNRPVKDHPMYTAADVADSIGATFAQPRNGYRAPLSISVVGTYKGHDPFVARPQLAEGSDRGEA